MHALTCVCVWTVEGGLYDCFDMIVVYGKMGTADECLVMVQQIVK